MLKLHEAKHCQTLTDYHLANSISYHHVKPAHVSLLLWAQEQQKSQEIYFNDLFWHELLQVELQCSPLASAPILYQTFVYTFTWKHRTTFCAGFPTFHSLNLFQCQGA